MPKYGSREDALRDDDLVAMGATSRHGSRAWLGWLFVVLSLTFAAGYYAPLYRTHQALVTEYTTLAERVTGVEKDLTKTRADLAAVTAKNQELSQVHPKETTGGRERPQRLQGELSTKLASRIEKREIAVGMKGDAVRIRVPSVLKSVQTHWEVTTTGQSALCDVAAALSSTGATIVVVAELGEAKSGPGAPSARDVAASRAGSVARTLEQKCGYSSEKLATMTRPAEGGSAGSTADIALQID